MADEISVAPRRVPFPDESGARDFNRRFTQVIVETIGTAMNEIIPPENTHAFHHGVAFMQRRPDGSQMNGEVEPHRAQTTLKFEDIVAGELSVLPAQILSVVNQMRDDLIGTLYNTVSEAVEEVGNVVNAKGRPVIDAYLEMLSKIEFGVNRKGEVTRPEIHPPEMAAKFENALKEASPELIAQVNAIIKEKEAQALARERERIGRFKTRKQDA